MNIHVYQMQPDATCYKYDEKSQREQWKQQIPLSRKPSAETPQWIIGRELQHLSEGAAIQLVRYLRRQVRRKRQVIHAPEPLPTYPATIELSKKYRNLPSGENFWLFNTCIGDENRILIFRIDQTLSLLSRSPNWFMDGTFTIVPEIFFQLYVVHALINGDVISCLYCLLPNKTTETYQRMFIAIKSLMPDVQPSTVMMEYENAAMNSISEYFIVIEVHSCFYHLS